MPEITNDTLVFDADELAWFIKYFGANEWAVYVSAMDEIHTHQDPELDGDDPVNAPHTEGTARATANWINANLKPRDELDPVMKAVVLHYGVPETQATLTGGTDTRHPGLITPDNAPRLADLADDSLPYPAQLTITCDTCTAVDTADYLVPADSTSSERFEIARDHMRRNLGWTCDEDGNWCPKCTKADIRDLTDARSTAEVRSPAALVAAFHAAFGLPRADAPTLLNDQQADFRHQLLIDEVDEAGQAIARRDLANLAQELADVVYVAYCTALAYGIDLDAVLAEVHRANMAKIGPDGKPVVVGGKVVKPAGWEKPDVAGVLGLDGKAGV